MKETTDGVVHFRNFHQGLIAFVVSRENDIHLLPLKYFVSFIQILSKKLQQAYGITAVMRGFSVTRSNLKICAILITFHCTRQGVRASRIFRI